MFAQNIFKFYYTHFLIINVFRVFCMFVDTKQRTKHTHTHLKNTVYKTSDICLKRNKRGV